MDQRDIRTGRDYFEFKDPSGNITIVQGPEEKRSPALNTLLNTVQLEVKERLEQSIHKLLSVELTNLGKIFQPSQVESPWGMTLNFPAQPPKIIPSETKILKVFEQSEVKKRLLLLGLPGSGKTTTMLELADGLLQRCEKTPLAPVPVLLNLASWKNPNETIFDWLVGEIKAKYSVRAELGANWLRTQQVLPLLDGLDEVDPKLQKDCAIAINQWLRTDPEQQPVGTLVCCRIEEYQTLVQHLLCLNAAIELQPLSDAQIATYFQQFGIPDVWSTIQSQNAMVDLLRQPLFLSIFGLVAVTGHFELESWQRYCAAEKQWGYLFNQYWEAMMARPLVNQTKLKLGILSQTYGKKPPPTRKNLRHSICFMATILDQEAKTEYLIEQLQPSQLPNKKQKLLYRLIGGLIGGLIFGLIGGLSVGLDNIDPVEAIKFSMSRKARREILKSLQEWLIGGLIVGLIVGLIFGLIDGCRADIENRVRPNQGILNSRNNVCLLAACSIPFGSLVEFIVSQISVSLAPESSVQSLVGSSLVMIFFPIFYKGGGLALIQHISLRIVLKIYSYAPYRYDRLLNYAVERRILQRVGGRYRFIHKLLQAHFATMELDPKQ